MSIIEKIHAFTDWRTNDNKGYILILGVQEQAEMDILLADMTTANGVLTDSNSANRDINEFPLFHTAGINFAVVKTDKSTMFLICDPKFIMINDEPINI